MKKNWKKPVAALELFRANEYVSTCTIPASYVRVYAPVQETNGLPGWQEHNAPDNYSLDTNGVNADGWFDIYDPYEIIRAETDRFEYDDNNCYYMFTLTKDVANENGTKTYQAGTILYKNYNPGLAVPYEKNRS